MTEPEDTLPQAGPEKPELVLDLNFVPQWAQKPPPQSPYAHFEGRGGDRGGAGRGGGDRRDREAGRDRRDPRDRDRTRERGPRRGGPDERGRRGERAGGDGRPGAGRRVDAPERDARPAVLPLDVDFLPERHGLVPLSRRLALTGRAYPLFDLAAQFLSKPEYYAVKLTVTGPDGTDAPALQQCKECNLVFADRERAASHALHKHAEKFYRKEETEAEPPKGNFACIARCGLSGELLGPPNYHGFNNAVVELHRSRYAHLSIDDYRRRIENLHDAALIEQWKEKMRKQTVYHLIDSPEPVRLEKWADVEAHFRRTLADGLIRPGRRFVLSGVASQQIDDSRIADAIRDAWNRETRFPLRFSITLRLAFRHLGMHLFKAANGGTFITSICPAPIDPATAVPVVRRLLEFLAANPGALGDQMLERMLAEPSDPPVTDVQIRQQLRWLIGKGHVIEFADGRLAVPVNAVSRIQYARKGDPRGRKPDRPAGRPRGPAGPVAPAPAGGPDAPA